MYQYDIDHDNEDNDADDGSKQATKSARTHIHTSLGKLVRP